MKVIGLTGGIGSGKTTVASIFKTFGIPVYIADIAAKKIMDNSAEVREEIIQLLGQEAYHKEKPNRPWIAARVFKNKPLLEALNTIIHPRVKIDFENWLEQQNAPYIIYEAAILFENGGETRCHSTILVTAPKNLRFERLLHRDHTTIEKIEARIAAQWSDEKKRKLADYIVENKTLTETKAQIEKLHIQLTNG